MKRQQQQPGSKSRDTSNSREPSAASTPEKCAYNSSNAGNSRDKNSRVVRRCIGTRDINGSKNIDIDLIATARHLLQQSNKE
jgi:hypothetical protein